MGGKGGRVVGMRTYPDAATARAACVSQGAAEWLLPIDGRKSVKLIANDVIFRGFDDKVFEQAVNTAEAPGVEQVIVGPDGHAGYGCPVGSVVVTDGYMYPGPVGPDICCSMSYLQTNVPDEVIADKATRRALLNAIGERIPTGMGSRQGRKARRIPPDVLATIPIWGANPITLDALGIPPHWHEYTEAAQCGPISDLAERLDGHESRIKGKLEQLGSLGGGNHFAECQASIVALGMESLAAEWRITGRVGFLTHCGSRGFGFQLAALHFRGLENHFARWGIPLPGGERELVYAPIDSPEGWAYYLDMCLGANFAVVNHLLINAYIAEAFTEVLGPQVDAHLVYHVSHNIGREEIVGGAKRWVFRKGATRAFPAGHHDLKGTRYADTGHPVLLPGNPEAGSYVMVGQAGSVKTAFSLNHGAGRAMGRNHAKRTLNQQSVDAAMLAADILYNGRSYPLDEAPAAYKDFVQVTASVEEAGLAKVVAKLRARFVVKDGDQSAEGAA